MCVYVLKSDRRNFCVNRLNETFHMKSAVFVNKTIFFKTMSSLILRQTLNLSRKLPCPPIMGQMRHFRICRILHAQGVPKEQLAETNENTAVSTSFAKKGKK